MFCSNCGTKAVQGNFFCTMCGQALDPALPVKPAAIPALEEPSKPAEQSVAAEAGASAPPVDQTIPVALGGWCSTGVYGGGRDPLGGRERFNGWSPLSILLLAVGFEGCGELLVAVGGCLGPCRRPWGSHRWVNSG